MWLPLCALQCVRSLAENRLAKMASRIPNNGSMTDRSPISQRRKTRDGNPQAESLGDRGLHAVRQALLLAILTHSAITTCASAGEYTDEP